MSTAQTIERLKTGMLLSGTVSGMGLFFGAATALLVPRDTMLYGVVNAAAVGMHLCSIVSLYAFSNK